MAQPNEFIAPNLGRTAGADEGLDASCVIVTTACPTWAAAFFSEMDAFQLARPAPRSVHIVDRHFPGAGCSAMAWVIRRPFACLIRSIRWRGRCGALHLFQRPHGNCSGVNIFLVGLHAAHGDLLNESLADAGWLLRRRPYGAAPVILGD